MSTPTSLKLAPPGYIDPRIRRKFIALYILQFWITGLVPAFLLYWFFYDYIIILLFHDLHALAPMSWSFRAIFLPNWDPNFFIMMFFIPVALVLIYLLTSIWSAYLARLLLTFLNLLHKPCEGVFYRTLRDKDYVFWNLRNYLRVIPNWFIFSSPMPVFPNYLAYRLMGIRIGNKVELNHAWISQEFVSIGNHVVIGQACAIYSFQIEDDKVLVASVSIEDEAILGPQVVVFPGTIIKQGATLDGGTFNHPFSEYQANTIYHGAPAKPWHPEDSDVRNTDSIRNPGKKK